MSLTSASDATDGQERTHNQVGSQENERNSNANGCTELSSSHASGQTLEEMESGGR